MSPFTDMLLWLSRHFTTETYLFYTRIQGVLWSIVDLVLIFFLLKMIELAGRKKGRKRIRFRYLLLLFTAVLVPFLSFVGTSKTFFLLESVICGIHFSILIYIVIMERKMMLAFMKDLISPKWE
ncbi:MAG: hypothetical protein ABII06_15605 [Pseudomonadota bacterium]